MKSISSKTGYSRVNSTEDGEVIPTSIIHAGSANDIETLSVEVSASGLRDAMISWIAMFFATLSGAAIGPIFKYLNSEGIPPTLAACWRTTAICVFMIPLAVGEVLVSKDNRVDWLSTKVGHHHSVIVYVIIAGLSWAINLISWVVGLKYTSAFKASIFASLHPLILCFYFKYNGIDLSLMEWLGVIVSFVGVFISGLQQLWSPEENSAPYGPLWETFGLGMCFLAAVMQVSVVLNRAIIKPHVPIWQVRCVFYLPPPVRPNRCLNSVASTALLSILQML
jgi:drug/metabolite transporter (DMT)-like permease